MLTRVEVRTRQGTQINLPLEDVDNGYIVAEIEGLDPVKATYSSSTSANRHGERKHSSRREKRNMKLKLELEPDYENNTVKSLRENLYRFLIPNSEVTLRFHDSVGSYVDIVADVESFDAPLFTEDPVADISLLCFDPDFFDPNPITVSGVSTADVLAYTTINYFGSVDAGILFTLRPDRNIPGFSIFNTSGDGITRQLEFDEPLIAGDEVTISTVPGAKGAIVKRDNVESSILYAVSTVSNWIVLKPGENRLRVGVTGNPIPYEIQYVTRYGGL
jgi:hypothetical protein